MNQALALLLVCCVACASTTPRPPVVDPSKWVETEELPPHPKSLPLPEGLDSESENFVVPIDEGMCDPPPGQPYKGACPEFHGIMVSEARAARDGFYRIQYEELRSRYAADRNVWAAQRTLYETQLARDAEYVKTLQPTWWEQHDGQVLGIAGFALGAAVILGLAKAVSKTTEN